MAKRGRASVATEHKIEEFAADLGTLLGKARNKAEGWLGQRKAIVQHLTEIRDTATDLLSQLGHEARAIVRRGRTLGQRVGVAKRGPSRQQGSGRKRRKMSAEARARISAAQKKRWAKQKAGGKK